MDKVSVIIPSYNSALTIERAIKSVLFQTYKAIEVVVVDDGSSDNTVKYVTEHFPDVKIVCQENKGPAAARNSGIKNSTGDFLAFLDADDSWVPEKIECQMNEMLLSASVGLVTCGSFIVEDESASFVQLRDINYLNRSQLAKSLLERNRLGGCSYILVRRSCFQNVGIFDESLLVSEDRDMWFRIALKYDCRSVNKPLLHYYVSSGSQSSDPRKNIDGQLKFLNKIFSQYPGIAKGFSKRGLYVYHFYKSSWSFLEAGNAKMARKYILKAIQADPLLFFLKAGHGKLFIRLFLGMGNGIRRSSKLRKPVPDTAPGDGLVRMDDEL
jgi:glycosyltransferase involved in cell wall biosynthesis